MFNIRHERCDPHTERKSVSKLLSLGQLQKQAFLNTCQSRVDLPTAWLMLPELPIAATVAAATAALRDANELPSRLEGCDAEVEAIGPVNSR